MKENENKGLTDDNIAEAFMLLSDIIASNENAKHSIIPALKAMWNHDDEIINMVAFATNHDFNFSDQLLDNLEAYEETLEESWQRINDENNSSNDNPFQGNKLLK